LAAGGIKKLKVESRKVKRGKVFKCSSLQKMLLNQQRIDLSKLSLVKKCPVAKSKCGRTSKNSCQANEGLALRALALDRAAVQATKSSTFPQFSKPEITFCSH